MRRMETRRMNFALCAAKKHSRKRRLNVPLLLIILVVAALVLTEAALLGRVWFRARAELSDLLVQMSDIGLQTDYETALGLEAELSGVQAMADGLTEAFAAADAYPEMDDEMLALIRGLAGERVLVTGFAYTGTSGVLTIYGRAGDALAVSEYAGKLRAADVFVDVDYYGYDSDEEKPEWAVDAETGEASVVGAYAFEVLCAMEGGGGE